MYFFLNIKSKVNIPTKHAISKNISDSDWIFTTLLKTGLKN